MLRQHNGGAQLAVDLAQHRQKVRRGDGVKLAGRLVQNQHIRLHGHDGRQIQKLLLPAGQLRDTLIKPSLNAEKGCHFRHAAAYGGRILAQAFQPEGQLMPHLIGDDLVFRRLLHKADAGSLCTLVHLLQRRIAEANAARADTVRGQRRLQLPQQRGFSAARGAAQHHKRPLRHGQRQIVDGADGLLRVGECQVLDGEQRHARASLLSKMTGVRHKARYTR